MSYSAKIFFIVILFSNTILWSQLTIPTPPADWENQTFGERMEIMDNYFYLLSESGVDLETNHAYKYYKRELAYWQYFPDYKTITLSSKSEEINDWIKSLGGNYGCVINTEYPFLSFTEIGPTEKTNASSWIAGTGQIHYIEFDNSPGSNRIFAASGFGGLFRSDDGGQNWYNAGTDQGLPISGVSSVALSVYDQNTWYITTGNSETYINSPTPASYGVWRTTDGGSSYLSITDDGDPFSVPEDISDKIHKAPRARKVISIPVGGHNRLVVACTAGLFYCENGDIPIPNWQLIDDREFYDVEVVPNNSNVVYASGDKDAGLIKFEFDSGVKTQISDFNVSSNPVFQSDFNNSIVRRASIDFCESIADQLFIMITEDASGEMVTRLYRYDINLDQFIDKGPTGINGGGSSLFYEGEGVGIERHMGWDVSPQSVNGDVYIVHGNEAPMYIATNALDNSFCNWQLMTSSSYGGMEIHVDNHFVKFNKTATKVFVGNDGGCYSTLVSDPINNWTSLNKGLGVSTASKVSTSENGPRRMMAGFQDMAWVNYHLNAQGEWLTDVESVGDGDQCYINKLDSDYSLFSSTSVSYNTNGFVGGNTNISYPSPGLWVYEANASNPDQYYISSYSGLGLMDPPTSPYSIAAQFPVPGNLGPDNDWVEYVKLSENPLFSDYIYCTWKGGLDPPNGVEPINARIYRSTVGGSINPTDWEFVTEFDGGEWTGGIAIKYDDPNVIWYSDQVNIWKHDLNTNTKSPYNEGLPTWEGNNQIVYVNGSNDGLLCARTSGLYFRDASMSEWRKICGIPNSNVKDIEIDYCRRKIVICFYGRGVWSADLDVTTDMPLTISSNYTITGDFIADTDIIVESGILTIHGTLYMPAGAKIIVKPGASINIDGGKITNDCGELWAGIQVWGNSSGSQFVSGNQGRVELSNGAIIEHAEVGIAVWEPGNWASTGGIVKSNNSFFYNNRKDVEYLTYSNDHLGNHYSNLGKFRNTEFIWDDFFRSEAPLAHVTIYKNDGIRFTSCIFADRRSNQPYQQSSRGILSIDANYKVEGSCSSQSCVDVNDPSWVPTLFEDMYYGIYAMNATNNFTINVDGCKFVDNGYGVQMVSVPNAVIVRNAFQFTDNPDHIFSDNVVHGVHMYACPMVKIEENGFARTSPTTANIYGIVSSSMGPQNEQTRKNVFQSITYANFAQGLNRSDNSGLEFLCNLNIDNVYDQRVVGYLWDPANTNQSYGVNENTGSDAIPTGNLVTDDLGILVNEHYFNTSENTVFYTFLNQTGFIPDFGEYNFPKVAVYPSNTTGSYSDLCPSTIDPFVGGGGSGVVGALTPIQKDEFVEKFYLLENELQTKEQQYEELELSTSEINFLLTEVANLRPNNKQEVRDLLTQYSPFLTTEILFAVADNTPSDYNHPWLRDLMIANIEAVTPELLQFLLTKDFPLPSPMIQDIQSAIGVVYTDKTILKSEISQIRTERSFVGNTIIADFQHDTLDFDQDSLRIWLEIKNDIFHDMAIIDSYLQEKDLGAAKSEVDELESNIESFPDFLQQEVLDMIKLYRWMLGVLGEPGGIADKDNILFLQSMSNVNNIAGIRSQNLLCFFFDQCPENFIVLEEGSRGHSFKIPSSPEKIEPIIGIRPNPAHNWVMIEIDERTISSMEGLSITITDITGKTILQTNLDRNSYLWETMDVENGLYIIAIRNVGGPISTEKVIIQH